jgi:hypothetical protein
MRWTNLVHCWRFAIPRGLTVHYFAHRFAELRPSVGVDPAGQRDESFDGYKMRIVEARNRARLDALLLSEGDLRCDAANSRGDRSDQYPAYAGRDAGAGQHDNRAHGGVLFRRSCGRRARSTSPDG